MQITAFLLFLLLLQGVVLLSTAADLDPAATVERQFPYQPKPAPKVEEKTYTPVYDNPTVPNYNPYSSPKYNYPDGSYPQYPPKYNNYPDGPNYNNYPAGPHYNNPTGSCGSFPSKFFFPLVIPYYYYPYAPYNVYFPPYGQNSGQSSGQNSGNPPAEKTEYSKPKN